MDSLTHQLSLHHQADLLSEGYIRQLSMSLLTSHLTFSMALFKCKKCDRQFASSFNLKRHEATYHAYDTDEAMDESSEEGSCEEDEGKEEFEIDVFIDLLRDSLPDGITSVASLLNNFKVASAAIMKHVWNVLNDAEALQRMKLIGAILEKKKKYSEKDGMAEDESFEKAWKDRKYGLKCFIKRNAAEINKGLFQSDDDEEEEEEERSDQGGIKFM